jgi:hypothetical protein
VPRLDRGGAAAGHARMGGRAGQAAARGGIDIILNSPTPGYD